MINFHIAEIVEGNVTVEVPPPGLRVTDDKIVRVIDLVPGQSNKQPPLYGKPSLCHTNLI